MLSIDTDYISSEVAQEKIMFNIISQSLRDIYSWVVVVFNLPFCRNPKETPEDGVCPQEREFSRRHRFLQTAVTL